LAALPLKQSTGLQDSISTDEERLSDCEPSSPTSSYLTRPVRSIDAARTMVNVKARLLKSNERRGSDRYAANLSAKASGLQNFTARKCVVSDISETGIRISFSEPIPELPKFLKLHIEDLHLIVKCELKWQRHRNSGMAFVFGSTDF